MRRVRELIKEKLTSTIGIAFSFSLGNTPARGNDCICIHIHTIYIYMRATGDVCWCNTTRRRGDDDAMGAQLRFTVKAVTTFKLLDLHDQVFFFLYYLYLYVFSLFLTLSWIFFSLLIHKYFEKEKITKIKEFLYS